MPFKLYGTRPNTIKQIMCPNGNVWSSNSSWSPNIINLFEQGFKWEWHSFDSFKNFILLCMYGWRVISHCYSSTSIVITIVYVLKKSHIKTLVIVSNRNLILFFSASKRWAWSRDCDQVFVCWFGQIPQSGYLTNDESMNVMIISAPVCVL